MAQKQLYCDHYTYTGPAEPQALGAEKAEVAMDLARLEAHKEGIAFAPKLPDKLNSIVDGGLVYYIGYHGH